MGQHTPGAARDGLWRTLRGGSFTAASSGGAAAPLQLAAFAAGPERGCPQPQHRMQHNAARPLHEPMLCGPAAAEDSRAPAAAPSRARHRGHLDTAQSQLPLLRRALDWQSNKLLSMKRLSAAALALLTFLPVSVQIAQAWDYEGHRTVNLLALASLPTNFPAFVREPAAEERIGFLAGEMDRWRNSPDLPLQHYSFPDHYLDMEELSDYGLNPETLPIFRYDLVAQLALIRKAHPEKFRAVDGEHNRDHTRELIGFLPWAIAESVGKVKSGFSYLHTFEEAGTPEEVTNAKENIIYMMGVMGHLAGDASQPLHTTIHHHGWVGSNPNHYSTNHTFHSWIDGGYLKKTGGIDLAALKARLRPARAITINGRPAKPEEMFQVAMLFVLDQNKLVEPLYQLDKEGKLSGEGEKGLEGKAFLEGQLLKSAQLLGDFWVSAWQQAPPDTFLKAQLAKRARKAETK
jgi:hypothetical protein